MFLPFTGAAVCFQSKQQDRGHLPGATAALPRPGDAGPQQQRHRRRQGRLLPRAAAQEPVSVFSSGAGSRLSPSLLGQRLMGVSAL